MTCAIPVHVALVDQSGEVSIEELQKLAGSLNEQIQRDFTPVWNARATVGAYTSKPSNTWAVIIKKTLNQPGALGYHTDNNNQPVAYVEYQPGPDGYTVTVSHETLEMLADPFGNRMHGALLPQGISASEVNMTNADQHVQYLLEVCDPCEVRSYSVGGIELSDFLLPAWYYSSPAPGSYYSHAGECTKPRQVADSGYVSFATPDNNWWQVFNDLGQLSVESLGQFDSSYGSLREWVDQKAREYRLAE